MKKMAKKKFYIEIKLAWRCDCELFQEEAANY